MLKVKNIYNPNEALLVQDESGLEEKYVRGCFVVDFPGTRVESDTIFILSSSPSPTKLQMLISKKILDVTACVDKE